MTRFKKKFYITTAIDYVNNLPHIGTAYEKIGADVVARFHRLLGDEVHFQMGSDEHSVNVYRGALREGLEPKRYCDQMRRRFEEVWQKLSISYDDFIQTSEPRHTTATQKLFKAIQEKGDIYKGPYQGWYCESCEAFYTEKDLAQGLCPNHKSKPVWIEEENYFFCLSRYGEKLKKYIESNPEFILPESRRNEILKVITLGLKDISISRATQPGVSDPWGIPVPGDRAHNIYVWFDALVNYITAVGYGARPARLKRWWPADLHVIGKDITRFHCIIWPAMLLSAGLKLPQRVVAHGFVYLRGEKMSKTLGNIVNPLNVVDRYGADALRYYLLRNNPFGSDGDFTWENFIARYNGDLANGLGNLVSRILGMADRYTGGKISPVKKILPHDQKMADEILAIVPQVTACLDLSQGDFLFHEALARIWEGVSILDRYINENAPWELAKKGGEQEIRVILYQLSEGVRVLTILLSPFLPEVSQKIWEQLGFESLGKLSKQDFSKSKIWGFIKKPIQIGKGPALFPRIESKGATPLGKEEKMIQTKPETRNQRPENPNPIESSEFSKIDLRVAKIVFAEKVPGADRVLKLQIDLGDEKRQIVAGIAQHYTPEELVGRKIVVVANLKPAKIRGIESQGMLLAASDDETISILTPLKDVAIGSKVK